jgi:hypothetical protein
MKNDYPGHVPPRPLPPPAVSYTTSAVTITLPPGHKLNADQTVAVATDVFWNEDMSTCPRGAKVQLLGTGGVAVYGDYHGDPFWQAWAPLPKRRRK